jgi:hypothetical protein
MVRPELLRTSRKLDGITLEPVAVYAATWIIAVQLSQLIERGVLL